MLNNIAFVIEINIKLDIMPLNPGQQPPPPIPAHVPPPPPPVIAQPVPVIQAASLPLSQSPAQMLQASRAFNPHAPRAAADNSSAAAAKPSTSEAALALMAAKNLQEASSSKSMSVPGHSVKRSKLRGPASARGSYTCNLENLYFKQY